MPARRGGNARLHLRTASTTSAKHAANQNAAQAAVANVLSKGGLKRNGNSVVEVRGQIIPVRVALSSYLDTPYPP